ncbi:hypothetical protein ANCDUO_09701 [Ancylostoma duodenale]|uniref:Uncharacterized protein n=1 Tax=Ancylostoma duodenale TaxID=51022 RepID=A0A0C2GFY0_9BILA|nr:hypothetical protein ANCDUO_09701 [Ancylostoma duodenale]
MHTCSEEKCIHRARLSPISDLQTLCVVLVVQNGSQSVDGGALSSDRCPLCVDSVPKVTPPNPRDFTIAPNVKREDLKKILEEKNGDSIINERLLHLLLPSITPESTTVKLKKPYAKKARWSQEDSKEFQLDSSELAILEREYLRKLAQLKAQKKERENRRHLEYDKDNEETENEEKEDEVREEATTTTTTKTERTTKLPKNSQQFTVVFHTASKEDFDEKAKMESKVRSILSSTIKEQEKEQRKTSEAKKSMEKINKGFESMEETTTEESTTTSETGTTTEIQETTEVKPTSVEAVAEAALRNALKEKEDDTEEFVQHSKAYAASLLSQQSDGSPGSSTTKPSIASAEEGVATAETPETTADSSTTSTPTIEPETTSAGEAVPANILNTEEAAEVNEVLSLIEADEKAEKAEGVADSEEIKRLRERTRAKIMAFLQRRESKEHLQVPD